MRIEKDVVVTIEYTATLDDGTVVDSTDHCGPVTYLHGNEQIFPALEEALDGLRPGDAPELRLAPERAWGVHRPELVRRMPMTQLPPSLVLTIGERYKVRGPDNAQLVFTIVGIDGDEVIADFNPRGAGQGLTVRAKVLAVRSATEDERRRGTVR